MGKIRLIYTIIQLSYLQQYKTEKTGKKIRPLEKISENGSVEDIITLDTNTDMNNGG